MTSHLFGDIVEALRAVDLQVSFTELRDMLWLAKKLDSGTLSLAAGQEGMKEAAGAESGHRSASRTDAEAGKADEARYEGEQFEELCSLYGYGARGTGGRATQLRLAGAPALPNALAIGGALRPLSRRRSGTKRVLDERATAEFVADTGVHGAVWRPMPERWFDVVLAVEDVASLAIWRPMVDAFERLLDRQGGFRAVKRLTLRTIDHAVLAYSPSGREVSIRELQDRQARCIVLVLSDCTSQAWQKGYFSKWLAVVNALSPSAIVQLLPQTLWPNTAVGFAELRVTAGRNSVPNAHLRTRRPGWAIDEPGTVMPVVELTRESFRDWGRMLTAGGDAWCVAALLPSGMDDELELPPERPCTSDQRLDAFRAIATEDAQRLASYLSVVKPLTPPVMRVIQHAMLPASGAVALAQIVLGGLVFLVPDESPIRNNDEREYDFHDGLRELFARSLTGAEVFDVTAALHGYLQEATGTEFDFFALLEDDDGIERLPSDARPFVQYARTAIAPLLGPRMGPGRKADSQSRGELRITQSEKMLVFDVIEGERKHTHRLLPDHRVNDILWQTATNSERSPLLELAQLIVPRPVRSWLEKIGRSKLVPLFVDHATSAYPWELLLRGNKQTTEPWAVSHGVSRSTTYLDRSPSTSAHPALIVAPSDEGETSRSSMTQWQGGERIAAALSTLVGPENLVRENANSPSMTLRSLMESAWSVLHIVAESNLKESPFSAASQFEMQWGFDTVVGVEDFRLLRTPPDLVFLQCDFASTIATELIALGVKVVIAPFGRIDPRIAATFAEVFYEQLHARATLIRAIARARRVCFERHPRDDTWGRFQCYGDPALRIPDFWAAPSYSAESLEETKRAAALASDRRVSIPQRASSVQSVQDDPIPKLFPPSIPLVWRGPESRIVSPVFGLSPIDGKLILSQKTSYIEEAALPWLPKCSLIKITDLTWEQPYLAIYFIARSNSSTIELVRLDGTSPPIHDVNRDTILLDESNVLVYFKFFCFFVRGEEGPFYIVESPTDPILLEESDPSTKSHFKDAVPAEVTGRDDNGRFLCNAIVWYSNALFSAAFAIDRTGMVEMLDDESIADDLPKLDRPIVATR